MSMICAYSVYNVFAYSPYGYVPFHSIIDVDFHPSYGYSLSYIHIPLLFVSCFIIFMLAY